MSDMPERIWAFEQSGSHVRLWRQNDDRKGSTEYVRADKVQELVDVLTRYHEWQLTEDRDASAWSVAHADTYAESELGKATAAALACFTTS